jgi:hypothetical protein
MKSFYLFEGSWFYVFDKLVGIIKPGNAQRFSIWESKKRSEGHLLIMYGNELTEEWQGRFEVKKITEPEFQTNFKSKMREHIIHGYNEFTRA